MSVRMVENKIRFYFKETFIEKKKGELTRNQKLIENKYQI